MKTVTKSKKLEGVNYAIRGEVLKVAEEMESKGTKILKLNIGNPYAFNLKAPNYLLETMKNNLIPSQSYSSYKGIEISRKAIVEYYNSKNINDIDIEDVYLGNGVSELILISMQALLNKDDEVLVPMPDYPLWTAAINLAGGKAVHYLCDENNEWNPDINDIKKKITKNTKAIVIINPNNPTGALYPKEILEEIINIARENGLIIYSDEIYDRLVYDELEHISIASLTNDIPIFTFSGLSKSHMVAGYRVGWMCISGNKEYIKEYINGLNLLLSMRLCSNVPGQYIIEDALKDKESTKALLRKGGRLYEQREYIYNRLKQISGINVVKPKAGFYIFPKIDIEKFNITDDKEFVLNFLKEKHVLLVHGTGFNWQNNDHFRVVFLANKKKLEKGIDLLEEYLLDL